MARNLVLKPKVILFDEPTSSLDPISTRAIEDMMLRLKKDYTVIFVTHNIQQAQRIVDELVFISGGQVIEKGLAAEMLKNPQEQVTERYLKKEVGNL
jgi:phosphate transport system ATP-binding protein